MSALLVAVLLSLVSAVAYAVAAVAQARLASRNSGAGALRLLGSGAWWGAVTLNALAALLHVVALKYGPLTVVQPLGAFTLVAAVPLGARMAGRRVSVAEWRGTALTLAGLAAILATASGPAPDDVLSVPEALAVAGGTASLLGLLSWPGSRPGLRHATASGIASGVASALTQTVTVAATDRTGPLLDVRVVGVALLVAVFAAGGLLLAQTAYRGGLGAPLAVVTLANPLAAAVIGLGLLGEELRGGATGILLGLTGAGFASWGVVLLSRATHEPARATEAAAAGTAGPQPAVAAGAWPAAPADSLVAAPGGTGAFGPAAVRERESGGARATEAVGARGHGLVGTNAAHSAAVPRPNASGAGAAAAVGARAQGHTGAHAADSMARQARESAEAQAATAGPSRTGDGEADSVGEQATESAGLPAAAAVRSRAPGAVEGGVAAVVGGARATEPVRTQATERVGAQATERVGAQASGAVGTDAGGSVPVRRAREAVGVPVSEAGGATGARFPRRRVARSSGRSTTDLVVGPAGDLPAPGDPAPSSAEPGEGRARQRDRRRLRGGRRMRHACRGRNAGRRRTT